MLTVTLESTFTYTLAREDFSVNLTSSTNASISKQLNVVSVDDGAKTLSIMFGGAWTGDYLLKIRHAQEGLVGSSALILNVGATVTAVSPMISSIYGGAILTITGTNFGTVSTDNPVQISYNGAVGSTHCFVLTTMATEITCMVDDTITKTTSDVGTVIVFLKTSEEATCASAVCGDFGYTDVLPTLTGAATQFDAVSGSWEVVATGTSFGDPSSATFMVGGVQQTYKSGSDTEAVFTLVDSPSSNLIGSTLLFAGGKPEGHAVFDADLLITPQFVSVTPLSGSVGGMTIRLNVPGATTADEGIDIKVSGGASICEAVRVIEYGLVECDTLAQEITSTALQMTDSAGTAFECVNSDTAQCQYE
jgi:hypothetical protein